MHTLVLVRHFDYDDKGHILPDEQGKAIKLAEWLAGRGVKPRVVLTTPVTRGQETALCLAGEFSKVSGGVCATNMVEQLNEFSKGDELLDLLKSSEGDEAKVAVTHKPVIQENLIRLAENPRDVVLMLEKIEKGTALSAEFDIQVWRELQPHTGKNLVLFDPDELRLVA